MRTRRRLAAAGSGVPHAHEPPTQPARSRRALLAPVYKPRELVLDHGLGARVWDTDGRDYIDFGARHRGQRAWSSGSRPACRARPPGAQALARSNVFYTEPPLRLAEELVTASGFAERVFLCNSGAEANEAAIKLVRKWAASRGRPPERRVILTFHGSFHGRTLATVTATAQPKYQQGYEPLPAGFVHVPFNDLRCDGGRVCRGRCRGGDGRTRAGRGRRAAGRAGLSAARYASCATSTTRCWC